MNLGIHPHQHKTYSMGTFSMSYTPVLDTICWIAPPPISVPMPAPMGVYTTFNRTTVVTWRRYIANMIARGEFAGAGGSTEQLMRH